MRSKTAMLVVLVLLIWVAAIPGQTADYYVDQQAANASDENPGTQEQPWKSLVKATEVTAKGDTVYVEAGTYREPLELTGEQVTVRAFGDDAVVLEPADEITEIKPGVWKQVPDQKFVYVCEPDVEGVNQNWRLNVGGLPIAFEVTQGARREITSSIGETRTVTVDAIPGDPLPVDGEQPFWLEITSQGPTAADAEGTGWWTRAMPTVPGAHIRVSLRVSGENLEPAEGQAIVALVRFSSLTDQHASRQYIIGADEDVLKGTFPWQTFTKELVAPPEAKRFALFVGVRPCTGKAKFAEVGMETLPGERPPQRPMPENVTYEPVDLSAYFNHDLDENVTERIGDGLHGAPGPIDLSGLSHGLQLHHGIPFEIDRAIALRGSMLPQDKSLPREVRGIRVDRKVAGLYFLHRFTYPARDREQFRYVLHFADGDTVEIPIVSGEENILGKYQRNNVRLFPPPFDLVGGGGVAEWVNPKPTVAVQSVDFVGADTGDAAVLGITAALAP